MKFGARASGLAFLVMVASALFFSLKGHAQLAITEMMSARYGAADFFELTNFGTNSAQLSGFRFTDADHKNGREMLVEPSESVLVDPGKSILFVRTNNNFFFGIAEFRQFWNSCLPPDVQVRGFPRPGFSSFGDSLTIFNPRNDVVDSVEFARSERPSSFVYDPRTGVFGVRSMPGEWGACFSETNHNVASPGTTTGPVPLEIVRQPGSTVVCGELEATFSVEAIGIPRPKFQWLFNDVMINGAESSSLVISNVNSQSEGAYSVIVFNGLSNILSAPAILKTDLNPAPPTIKSAPMDLTVVEYRTARFAIEVCAYPAPTYQWSYNGVELKDETNRVLFIQNCELAMSGSWLSVQVRNEFGTANERAMLYVTNTPPIRITEIQARPQPECDGHNDWFEITNYGMTDVPLRGYRFSDQPDITTAAVIDRPVIIHAGESVILVKNSSIGSFFDWWGPEQLPPNLQVIPYSGFSLSSEGDMLYLWSETAEDTNEYLDSISYSTNSIARSVGFELDGFARENTADDRNVFRAVQCGDLGSPGFTSVTPPRINRIERGANGVSIIWRGYGYGSYQIEFSDQLSSGWTILAESPATNSLVTTIDRSAGNSSSRFYRIRGSEP